MSKISQRQLDYLEFLVWRSKDADEFTRKCLIWLIRQSQGLTRDVRLVLTETNKVVAGFHDMCSEGGTTHFDELLGLVGADMDLDYGVACLRKGAFDKTSRFRSAFSR